MICLQDPVSETEAVLVKRHDVTRDVKINEQLTTQQEALQRCATAPGSCPKDLLAVQTPALLQTVMAYHNCVKCHDNLKQTAGACSSLQAIYKAVEM